MIILCSEPNYLRFVFNASEMLLEDSYDYIIGGGGTAGCPLAATLSTMFRVLVLERGGVGYGRPNLMTQEGFLNGFSLDHKLGTKIGGSTFDPAGKRYSTADLLTLARASKIRVAIYANVEKIILVPLISSKNL
ncbi:hypothetical protein K1719_011500 [Acacia pycnantha]|nr:hypothetical protein K1719_011500 [Acacia pycnantha]